MSIDTDEGPSPAVAERAEHTRYANEFETIVATFRTALETTTRSKLTIRVASLCDLAFPHYPMSYEQPVIYFHDRWGYPAVLRALARAIDQPAHVLGDLEGD